MVLAMGALDTGTSIAFGQTPVPSPSPAGQRLPIEVSGAAALEYDERTGILLARGAPVTVTRGSTVLRAPRIRYDRSAGVVAAFEAVQMEDRDVTLRAQQAELRLADDHVRATGDVVFRSTRDQQPATLNAPEIEGSMRTRRFVATGGVTVRRGEWTVTGQRIAYDDGAQVAVVTGEPRALYKDATMNADRMMFLVAEDLARAEGNVRLRRGDLVGTAPRAEVSGRQNRAVLSGGAQVNRGADRLNADVIDVDLERNFISARGTPHLVISPRN
jgi:lipopolysaccharide export system protein LptA